MSREEVERLLGGYATGPLSEDERRRLFDAALADQEVFEALAREQEFRDLLEAPGAREELLAALEGAGAPLLRAAAAAAPSPSRPAAAREAAVFWGWLKQPWPWAVAATAAFTAVVFFALRPLARQQVETATVLEQRVETAQATPRAAESAAEPAPGEPASGSAAPPRTVSEPKEAAAPASEAPAPAAGEVKAPEERTKADSRPEEAERAAPLPAAPAIAPAQPRKVIPPGAPPVETPVRDDVARAAGAAGPPPAAMGANELRPMLTYRLGRPTYEPGRDIELFLTAAQPGAVAVTRRTAEGWAQVASLRLEANKEVRVLVPTEGSGNEVELELSFDGGGSGAPAGFRDSSRPAQRVRVRVPRAE
jgi:hypothetical protein